MLIEYLQDSVDASIIFFFDGANLYVKECVFVSKRLDDHAPGVHGEFELRVVGQEVQSTAEATERHLMMKIEGVFPY